mmetsp:Transcript_39720/g.94285  ORF Transcript_39720/g.94285 Transcript_39720/m.94285 type:complete len:281 (+) Transcript_39720:164-1006(+)
MLERRIECTQLLPDSVDHLRDALAHARPVEDEEAKPHAPEAEVVVQHERDVARGHEHCPEHRPRDELVLLLRDEDSGRRHLHPHRHHGEVPHWGHEPQERVDARVRAERLREEQWDGGADEARQDCKHEPCRHDELWDLLLLPARLGGGIVRERRLLEGLRGKGAQVPEHEGRLVGRELEDGQCRGRALDASVADVLAEVDEGQEARVGPKLSDLLRRGQVPLWLHLALAVQDVEEEAGANVLAEERRPGRPKGAHSVGDDEEHVEPHVENRHPEDHKAR